MMRAAGLFCAGLVFVLAGCALNLGNTRVEAVVKIDEQAFDASLEQTATRVKQELERRGLTVTVAPEADAVRVVSKTKSGDRFTIVLGRYWTVSGKEQTKVRVEWDKAPDRELWAALIVAIGSAALQPGH